MAPDVTDALYPYFQSFCDLSDRRNKIVPAWRALVESEVGLEYLLQKLPPPCAEELRSQNSQGRDALEDCAWERAESSFLECKAVLRGASEHVEKRVYDFLLLWADLPLAQLYQARGTAQTTADSGICADMLQKALDVRKEMLDCVMPLRDSHAVLVKVCKSSYFTAQYEYGDLMMSSEVKDDAVHKYAELLSCNKDEAEAHVFILLWCDHYYSGNFEVSLRWIQEANRLWKQIGSRVWKCLQNEAELLMRLGKFPEAVIVLEDSMPYFSSDDQQPICQLLRQCYTQMGRRAETNGDPHQADLFNGLALSYYDPSLRRDGNQENIDPREFVTNPEGIVIIPISHPIMMRPPVPVGSWLGLVQADLNSPSHEPHLRKLPESISNCLKYHLQLAQVAYLSGDWVWATANYQMCREFVKITKKIVDSKTYEWLLTWVDLTLAYVYQYHETKPEKAIEIWKEMKDCAMHQMLSDEFLTKGYVLNLDVAEYEWMRSSTSEGHVEILRRRAECSVPHSNEREVERELCFWLYFHHHTQGNYKVSLGWLREAKRLQEEHCPDQECSVDPKDYFCCEYTFLRCEADLWMRLQMFEKAKSTLKDLLETRHVRQGSPRLAREAKQWLHKCESQIAVGCHRIIDDHEQEEIADEPPSSTGCIPLPGVPKFQLVQSQTGLEHHLHKLPVPIHLAFRRHSGFGRIFQHFADWENAVFNLEWCKELLKLSRYKIEKETYEWLTVWADVPLVDLYEFRKMQYRKALDLRREMFCMVPKDSKVYIALLVHIEAGMYQCALSDHPEVKDVVVKNFTKLYRSDDIWACEERCLLFLYQKYLNYGNLEASLHYIRQAKHHLPEQAELDDKKSDYVLKEALCLVLLRNFEEAEKLMREHWVRTNKKLEDLPAKLQTLMMASTTRRLDVRCQLELLPRASSGLTQLRLDSLAFQEKNEYEEALKCHQRCLEKINKASTDSDSDSEYDPIDYGHSSGVYDYSRLGELHMMMFSRRIPSLCGENIKDFQQDENFLRAVQSFEKCIELSSPQIDPLKVADVNYLLVHLYGSIDEIYGNYILGLYDQLKQQHASVPYSSSGTCINDADRLSLEQSQHNLVQVIIDYLEFQNPMPIYGTVASSYYTSSLYTMENQRNMEGWIEVLESHSYMYTSIQSYYYRRATVYSILDSLRNKPRSQEDIERYSWMAFMYAERERTRVMLYQIGSDRLNYSASRKLWSFDIDDAVAMKAIRRDCATLLQGDAVFVQYSPLTDSKTYLIYVVDQTGSLHVTHTKMEHEVKRKGSARTRSVEGSMTRLYKFLEPKKPTAPGERIDCAPMMKELEFLYDVLIEPIAEHLSKMDKEHKLILAPSKLLTKVPFAALRNSRTNEYLIERHTISTTSSLRALKICSERLQDLQSSPAEIGLGSIVALGHPAYNVCPNCQYKLKPLKWSAKEVDHISNLFGEKTVVPLLREKATAEELLDWAARPSREGCRQALIHIASHARVFDDKDHGKNVLHLACPLAKSVNNDPPTEIDERNLTSAGSRMQIEEDAKGDDFNNEEVTDFDDDDDDEASEDAYSDEEVTSLDVVAQTMIKSGMSISNRFIEQSVGSDRNIGNPVSAGQGPLRSHAITGVGRSELDDSSRQSNIAQCHNLKAEDICSLEPKWMAELVVLSACSSSRGKRTAEGVLSLARAFMIAGVPCAVASLWKVDDFATVALMETFYKELRKGADVTSALRSSMLHHMRQYPVKDWAPFNVLGVTTLRIPQALQQNT